MAKFDISIYFFMAEYIGIIINIDLLSTPYSCEMLSLLVNQ